MYQVVVKDDEELGDADMLTGELRNYFSTCAGKFITRGKPGIVVAVCDDELEVYIRIDVWVARRKGSTDRHADDLRSVESCVASGFDLSDQVDLII